MFISTEHRCLETDNKKTRLELVLISDQDSKWQGGFVRYGKSNGPVTLVCARSEEMNLGTRQESAEQTWLEVVGKNVTGSYQFDTSAATITGFRYTNKKSGKVVEFQDISGAMDHVEAQCLVR